MTRGELAGILRGGASALAKWGTDGVSKGITFLPSYLTCFSFFPKVDPFIQFRDSTFTELMERGKLRDDTKEVGIKVSEPLGKKTDLLANVSS